jgi:Holliday junction resolvasome RuvABC endonuclease subunit
MERTKHEAKELVILTNDPSITAWGFAVLNAKGYIFESGCIKTAPEQKLRRIRKSDDTCRRVSEVNQRLLELIRKWKVNYLLSELPHGSQNASAAVMIGITTGIGQTLSDALEIPIEWYSEGDSKKAVLHKQSASKGEMVEAISKLYRTPPWKTHTKYIDEAVADALAIHHVASLQSPILKYMKR